MCDEHSGLDVLYAVLKEAYTGIVERIEAGIAAGWRLPSGIAKEFRSRKGDEDYSVLCYSFIERVEFPPTWNRLDQMKFFGDMMKGERDDSGVLVCI